MKLSRTLVLTAVLAGGVATMLAVAARAGGDKVTFPADYDKGVMYWSLDRADNKQHREYFAPAAAIEAAKNGQPLPNGTVLTMLQYSTKLGDDGNPVKDANGKFIKDKLVAYAVMQKGAGWGAEYPDDVRNGEWEYQVFNAAKQVNDKANLKACFTCHKPKASSDYLFTLDQLKAAAK
ncbi:MAG TPA: cytochrome P460 family protein [Xanthobacteraceae bacterium]|nr:cytochrome P460 family protein [Xanthobacteraceae bacterium]